jgi:hypothetical protein
VAQTAVCDLQSNLQITQITQIDLRFANQRLPFFSFLSAESL